MKAIKNTPVLLRALIADRFGSYRNARVALCGMSELTISQVVQGRRKLSKEEADVWSDALGLPIDFLLGEEDSNE